MTFRHPHRRRPGADDQGERGETLIELIIAVAINGLGVVAVLGTLFSVVYLTQRNRGDVETAYSATYVLERIQAAPYESCSNASTGSYAGYLNLYSPKPTMTIEYLQDKNSATPTYGASCGTDQGLQRISLRVTQGVGRQRRITNLVLIKRDDRCPASATTSTSAPAALVRC